MYSTSTWPPGVTAGAACLSGLLGLVRAAVGQRPPGRVAASSCCLALGGALLAHAAEGRSPAWASVVAAGLVTAPTCAVAMVRANRRDVDL